MTTGALTTRGYVTDSDYTWGAYDAQSPTRIAAVAALNGCTPPPLTEPFTYCDLGCGNGLTLSLLASVHPWARFIGIDFNERHVLNARGFAAQAGVANVEFHCLGFEQAIGASLPDFDYATLHGVYTWVPQEVRAAILTLLHAKLKPQGFAYVAYNTMPGWAPLQPLRELMLIHGSGVAGGSLDKAREALELLGTFADAGAGYFARNPSAVQSLNLLRGLDLAYVAHEYFNTAWEPIYFHRMAAEAELAGLRYAGSLPLWHNEPDLVIPPALRGTFRSAPNRLVFEIYKDFVTNQQFRTDIFTRQPPGQDGRGRHAGLADLPLARLVLQERILREATFGPAVLELDRPPEQALLAALGERRLEGNELISAAAGAVPDETALLRGLANLAIAGQVGPVLRAPEAVPAPLPACVVLGSAANRAALAATGASELRVGLVSPVTGGIETLRGPEVLLLQGQLDGVPAHRRTAALQDGLARADRALVDREGKALRGEAAHKAALLACHAYTTALAPRLWRLGVLSAA